MNVELPPAQVAMFQDLIAQMKENNIQTKRIADFLEAQAKPQVTVTKLPPAKP